MALYDARPPFAAIGGTVPPEFAALPTPCYLLDEAALTRNAEILGNGTQCKPYIYVLDLVDAIVKLTEDFKPGENVYNISVESEGTTVTHIAEIVVDVLGLSDVKFEYTGGDRGWKGDVPRFSYDISKVLATGWKPKHTSDEAVRQTVKDAVEAGI